MVSTCALLFLVLISIVDEGESSLLNGLVGKSTIVASKNEGNAAFNETELPKLPKPIRRNRDDLDIALQITGMIEKAIGSPLPISSLARVIKKIVSSSGQSKWDQIQTKIDQSFAHQLTNFNNINIKSKLDHYKDELERFDKYESESLSETDRKNVIENIEDLFDEMRSFEYKFNPDNYITMMRYDPGFYQAYIAEISLKYLVMNLAMEHCKKLPSGQAVDSFQWRAWQDKIEEYKKNWAAFAKKPKYYALSLWSEKSLACNYENLIDIRGDQLIFCQRVGSPKNSFSLWVKKNIHFSQPSSKGMIDGEWYYGGAREMQIEMDKRFWYDIRRPILKLINDPEYGKEFNNVNWRWVDNLPECAFPLAISNSKQCLSPCRKYGYEKKWCIREFTIFLGEPWDYCPRDDDTCP